MNDPSVCIDLDDVLATSTPAILHALGANFGPTDYDTMIAQLGDLATQYDIVAHANKLLPDRSYTYESFWKAVTVDIWASFPLTEEALQLLELCANGVGKANVTILTAPIHGPAAEACLAGKHRWIERYMPDWIKRQYNITFDKGGVSRENKLLIDDVLRNTDAWRAHGGTAFLWPRPWNSARQHTLTELKERLDNWCNHAYARCSQLQFA